MSSLLTITPQGSIGGIDIQATLEAQHGDRLETTEHPVESGASITDHSYKLPAEVTLRCGWSNASTAALVGGLTSLFAGGGLTGADYVSGIYSQLLALQEGRTLFSITTPKRQYDNMLMLSLGMTIDQKTNDALMVTAMFREIIITSTQSTSIPPQSNQANPQGSAQTQDVGTASTTSADPAPGGSAPPTTWGE